MAAGILVGGILGCTKAYADFKLEWFALTLEAILNICLIIQSLLVFIA